MKLSRCSFMVGAALFLVRHACFPQAATAVPFLLIPPSPEANGMGGASSAFVSMHPMAPLENAGQMGFFAMSNFMNAGIYAPPSHQIAGYDLPDLSYSTLAVNAGVNLHDLCHFPFPLSLGIGYARVSFDLGQFTLTSSAGPTAIGSFSSYETSDNILFGAGVDYWVKLGFGVNYKIINSHLAPIGAESEQGTGNAEVGAYDIGILLQIPVTGIATKLGADFQILPGKTTPFLNLTLGYAKRNIGDGVLYVEGSQSDPLPRIAACGAGVEFGAESKMIACGWNLIDVVFTSEAEELLVTRYSDGTWAYLPGSGAIDFVDNVILGESGDQITHRKGWKVDIAEILSIRGGSVAGTLSDYSTAGFGIRLAGVLKLVSALGPDDPGGWAESLFTNIDVQYDYGKHEYFAAGQISESFSSIALVLKRIPF